MIRIISTLYLFSLSLCISAQNQGKETSGEFNGKLCNIGRGLCAITPPDVNNKSNTSKNYRTYKQANNQIIIELDLNNLSLQDQTNIFGKTYAAISKEEVLTFVQEDDFEFSDDSLIYLGLNTSYKLLRSGEYPLTLIDNTIFITLTLSQK